MSLTQGAQRGFNVFFSYAQKDEKLRDELDNQLSMLKRGNLIVSWHDYKILPGESRANAIETHLKTAHLILLLISPDFLASDYCYSTEMKQAMERHRTGEVYVLPIIMRPTADWKEAPFGKLQALPRNEKPVDTWENRNIAYVEIVDGIRNTLEKMHARQSNRRGGIVEKLPPTLPAVVRRRERIVKTIYTRLIQSDTTAMVLTGMGGVGKSTLANLVYHYAEEQRRSGNGPFTAEPLWLKITPDFTMADLIRVVLETLDRPPPDFGNLASWGQEAVLWNQAGVLFNALNVADKPRLVILDQFEVVLVQQTRQARPDRPGIGEWLDLLNSQSCTCRLLLTSRTCPRVIPDYPAGLLQEFPVDDLEIIEGEELLRDLLQAWDIKPGESELLSAVRHCGGHPLALVLLASLLRSHRSLNITALVNDPTYAQLWAGDIAHNLLDFIYQQQLDKVQRDLLLAFSIYREAVPLDAGRAVISSGAGLTVKRILAALDVLRDQHLLRDAGNLRYQLHPVVADYARNHFIEDDERASDETMRTAHARAAQYYQQQSVASDPPGALRRRIDDIHNLIEATWHWCKAGQLQIAYELIRQEDLFYDLQRWGESATLLELYQLLLPVEQWRPDNSQAAHIFNELGEVYKMLGQKNEARKYFERALSLFEAVDQPEGQVDALNNLGEVCRSLGRKEQALKYYQSALRTCEKIDDPQNAGKSTSLNNLGVISLDFRQKERALKYFEQALSIHRAVKYRTGEARTLINLGKVYGALNQKEEAYGYHIEALGICQQIGDRYGQGTALNNLGVRCRELRRKEEAWEYHEQALRIFREIGDRWEEGTTLRLLGRWYLYLEQNRNDVALACFLVARDIFGELQSPENGRIPEWITDELRSRIGEQQFETLLAEIEPRALQLLKQALPE